MPTRTPRLRPNVLLVDPHHLLPGELLAGMQTAHQLTIVRKQSRRKPSVLLVVASGEDIPWTLISYAYTKIAALPIVLLDMTPSVSRQTNAFSAGANGYVCSGVSVRELELVIEVAMRGGYSLCPGAHRMVYDQLQAPMHFSRRERDVVGLLACGASIETIAGDMRITVSEVEATIGRACHRIGTDSPVALAIWWTRWALSDETPPMFYAEDSGELANYVMAA